VGGFAVCAIGGWFFAVETQQLRAESVGRSHQTCQVFETWQVFYCRSFSGYAILKLP
jgi:hypothetical protein